MTNFLPTLGVLLLIAVVVWMGARQFNTKVILRETSPTRAEVRNQPTLEEVSSALKNGLRDVNETVERCQRTQGDELVVARRQLREALHESVTEMQALVQDEPQKSRLRRMMRLTIGEMWEQAKPWLDPTFALVIGIPMTADEMSAIQRGMWERAEAAIAACAEARGDELVAAQARLRQLIDDLDATKGARAGGLISERQVLMWQLAAEEIEQFAADALARHPEG